MKKVTILGSGNGSNFEAIVKYFSNKNIEFTCVSDKKDSFIHKRAEKQGIKSHYIPFSETYDFLKTKSQDLIVLAGYMRILPTEIIENFEMINIHPSLLPSFKGTKSIERAYNSGVKITGVTVHYVSQEVDSGKIIAQVPVKINHDEKLETLEQKIHEIEHTLYPKVINHLLFNKPLDIDIKVSYN